MCSSAVLTHQPHVGLQTVSALAGLAGSSLGPCKSYKWIRGEGGGEEEAAVLAGSCARLLESVEPSCAVGQLVGEAVGAHHAAYGSGAGCLLFMAGAWARGALECLRRGMPAPRVVHAMREGLDVCSQACRKHSVRFDPGDEPQRAAPSLSAGAVAAAAGRAREPQRGGRGKIKLTHSRYFCEAAPGTASVTPPAPAARDSRDIGPTARALSHGCVRSMELVLQASRLQSAPAAAAATASAAHCSVFDVSKVVTCVLPGLSEDRACVLPGCVVRLPAEKLAVVQLLGGRSLRVVLITGDLCERYRHLGSKRPSGVSHVTDRLDPAGPSREARWTESVLGSLLRLGVNLVLVSGATSESLSPHCLAHRILLVDKVSASVLRALAAATGAVPVTYATQLNERCVGAGARVTPWRDLGERRACEHLQRGQRGPAAFPPSCGRWRMSSGPAPTACTTPCGTGRCSPGAGLIEIGLRSRAPEHARRRLAFPGGWSLGAARRQGLYRDAVLRLMADGLTDYVATVMTNSGQWSKLQAWTAVSQKVKRWGGLSGVPEGETGLGVVPGEGLSGVPEGETGLGVVSGEAADSRVYDNVSVKLEAWRSAVDLVLLVMQTDAEVVTGIDPETLQTQTDFMLM
ncbi:Bardet-Biedl syndrome 12 [Merluccius polli]|uniref:Bardet-Biedl syndrome 12 n=1 Tax=Merluccius polli TaxID=89951 RepID=A0AA47P3F6_MERPO|nr:Bardet-Biedl syndrome 12 [Merluccius polli]